MVQCYRVQHITTEGGEQRTTQYYKVLQRDYKGPVTPEKDILALNPEKLHEENTTPNTPAVKPRMLYGTPTEKSSPDTPAATARIAGRKAENDKAKSFIPEICVSDDSDNEDCRMQFNLNATWDPYMMDKTVETVNPSASSTG
jgi:hypothetical protein